MRSLSGEGSMDQKDSSQQSKALADEISSSPESSGDEIEARAGETGPNSPVTGKATDDGKHSPESMVFDPFGLGPRREATIASIDSVSDFGGSTGSSPSIGSSSTARNRNLIQSFLKFAKHFGDDGRSVASDLTPNRNMEHSRQVLERLNNIFPNPGETLPKRKQKANPTKESATRKEKDEEKEIFVTETRPPAPLDEIIEIPTDDIIFGLSTLSHDSVLDQTISMEQEQTPLLDTTLGSEFESSTGLSKGSIETKHISDSKESKQPKYKDPSISVPIFSDDSDDEITFQKDTPHSILSQETGTLAGDDETQSKPAQSKDHDGKDKSGNSEIKTYPAGWKKKKRRNWLLAFAIVLFVTGIGLVVGTTMFPGVPETAAPSSSFTASPTEEVNRAPTSFPTLSVAPTISYPPSVITSIPSWHPTESTQIPSVSPTLVPSFRPSASTPTPSFYPSWMPSVFPTNRPSESPTRLRSASPTLFVTMSPVDRSQVPTLRPTPNPSTAPSKILSSNPTREASESPSISSSKSPSSQPSIPPTALSSLPSSQPSTSTLMPSSSPSKNPTEKPSAKPTSEPTYIPTHFPTISPTPMPSFLPTRMPLAPTLRPEEPSISPTLYDIISFTVPYKIFILNGFVKRLPQSEYVPDLIRSMDLLTADILLNIAKKKRLGDGRTLTEVVLPTSIIQVFDAKCPVDVPNSICQVIFAEISLINAEDTWELFEDTTELAIEIGRLQFHLEQVNELSPVEIIDAGWQPPNPPNEDEPDRKPTDGPVGSPIPISIPISHQRFPTPRPTFFPTPSPTANPTLSPTPLSLFNLLSGNSNDDGVALNEVSSPQFRAYSWLSDNQRINEYSEQQLLQRYSMATLYYATNGDNWLDNTSWMSDEPECTWFGKTGSRERCNNKGELTNLELDLNNLRGTLPPELGLLAPALETITLSGGPDSVLTGTLPTELGFLTLLKTFVVQNNDLSSTVPIEIGNWKTLEELDLSRNRLRGELPTQIGNFVDLAFFDVSNNEFSGSLPSEVGQLKKCRMMFFEENSFDSFPPTEIGSMRELRTLKGGSNKFGSLPTELGALRTVDFISFQNCSISGSIPKELGSLGKIRQLELAHNELSGSIPSELGKMKLLQKLDLSHNTLSGPLPTELGALINLRGIKLNDNILSEMIPSELSKLSKLTSIHLNSNDFSGTIPSAVCETFSETLPAFQADCVDFEDNCPCCTICCVEDICECRYLGTAREFLCFQRTSSSF